MPLAHDDPRGGGVKVHKIAAAQASGQVTGLGDLARTPATRGELIDAGLLNTGADAPRESTLAERRKIMDELDTLYDCAAGRYHMEASDRSVAEGLGVPRRWVSDIRAAFFGQGGGNEADAAAEAARSVAGEVERMERELATFKAATRSTIEGYERELHTLLVKARA